MNQFKTIDQLGDRVNQQLNNTTGIKRPVGRPRKFVPNQERVTGFNPHPTGSSRFTRNNSVRKNHVIPRYETSSNNYKPRYNLRNTEEREKKVLKDLSFVLTDGFPSRTTCRKLYYFYSL